ncbi:MAG: type II 3-dehydroquinate dehydratase [Betaproteobacteria bacterium]|nr:type II 3-dehydroquinate dehydratase [Betaproteobacteria bacterium]
MRRSVAKMTKKSTSTGRVVLVLNGPNLNLLGTREPETYGKQSLRDIEQRLASIARDAGIVLEFFQDNHEGVLVDRIQQAGRDGVDFIVINPAAYTHTSIAIRDALAAVGIPFIEVHLSNVHAREPFRRSSFLSDLALGTICGLGSQGYEFALTYALRRLNATPAG